MNKKKLVFLIISGIFIITMVLLAYDMYSRTTPPWEKKGEILEKYKTK